jgi:hypothetical protein
MPVSFPEFSGAPEDNPVPALIAFIRELEIFLDELVETNTDPLGHSLFWPPLYREMRPAWEEARQAGYFNSVIESVENISNGEIRRHGLHGQQLRFKLAVVRFYYAQYISVGKRVLKKLLSIIDDLLKSILDAVGAGGAISEIKDFIKDSVED